MHCGLARRALWMRVAHEGISGAATSYTPRQTYLRGMWCPQLFVPWRSSMSDTCRFDGGSLLVRLLHCLLLLLRLPLPPPPPSPAPPPLLPPTPPSLPPPPPLSLVLSPVLDLQQAVLKGPFRFVGASRRDSDNDRGSGGVLPRGHARSYERRRAVCVQPRAARLVSFGACRGCKVPDVM